MPVTTTYSTEKTYVYFDIRNYSGSSILSSYSLDICPLTFVPDFTTSELLSSSRALSNKVLKWDFGDDTFSTNLTATHTYRWPGQYKITLTIFDRYGNAIESTYSPTVLIKNFIADDIKWKDYGKFVYDVPASKIGDPLTILTRNSWQSYNALSASGITINLYASGAAGDYISQENFEQDKWSHLRLLSRFYEIQRIGNTQQYVMVESITANSEEIYARIDGSDIKVCSKNDPGALIAGVTGSNDIYYVDDKVKNYTTRENPIFLVASFNTEKFEDEFSQRRELFNYVKYPPHGFQSYEPTFLPIIKVRHNAAQRLSLTTTGIDGEGTLSSTVFDIPNISWQETQVPFLIKFKDFDNYTTKTYKPLSSSMVENVIMDPLSSYDVQFGILTYENGYAQPLSGVEWYQNFPVNAPQSIGGFYKGYFISENSAESCILTASVVVADPSNFPKDALIAWISIPQYSFVQRIFRQQIYDSCGGSVNMTLTGTSIFVNTSGNRQIFSISVAPSGAGKGNDYHSWLADSKRDMLLKFDLYGQVLSSIPLSAAPTLQNDFITNVDYRTPSLSCASPSNLALDGNSDLWVALFDTGKAIKINGVGGYVMAVAEPPTQNIMYLASAFGAVPYLSGFAGEGLFLPASIDTDINNNLWVAYSHPVSNVLVKYDPNGNIINTVYLPPVVSPIEICIDRNKNIWLTTFNHTATSISLTGRNDLLYKFDENGSIEPGFPLNGFRTLNNITVDGDQNAWVTHDRETITKVDGLTLNRTDYNAGSGLNVTNYVHSIVGLTCDTSNYIWAINDVDKTIYLIDTYLPPESAFKYATTIKLEWPPELPQYPVSAFEIRQFQAYGDWYGFRWINKYMVPTSTVRTVTGESSLFNIYPYTGVNNIAKINENWNAEEYYKSLRYQEVLLDKEKLFTEFLGGILGDANSQPYELGKTVYEKIANFVSNKSDVSTCTLPSFISFCRELSVPFEEYNYPFPPQLERLINILSINHKKLWGTKNTFNENFNTQNTYIRESGYGVNLGQEISIQTGIVSSGNPIVALESFSDLYNLVNFSQIPDAPLNTTVPLSTYSYNWGWGLVAPKSISGVDIANYYKFYEFIPTEEGTFYNNIINWNDPLTTLSPYNSSYGNWADDNGIIQTLLSYEMTKGFRLFTSAADITYNN